MNPINPEHIIELVGKIIGEKSRDLSARIEAIEKTPGPAGDAGKDAEPKAVADLLLSNEDFVELVKGVDGTPGIGIKAVEVEPDNSAFHFLFDNDERIEIRLPEPLRGQDADPEAVAEALQNNKGFLATVTGPRGERGTGIASIIQSEDQRVVKFVYDNDEAVEIELPAPLNGQDADPEAVAQALKADEGFISTVRGVQGERGAMGPEGPVGPIGPSSIGINEKRYVKNAIYRSGDRVTAYLGQVYEATKDTSAAPGDSIDWVRLGNCGFRFLGLKPDREKLNEGDLYIDGGSCFIWSEGKARMFVQKGKTGAKGAPGLDGKPGRRGDKGDMGETGRNGADGVGILEFKFFDDAIAVVLTNGDVHEYEFKQLNEMQNRIGELERYAEKIKPVTKLFDTAADDVNVPVRAFRGSFNPDENYQRGDMVRVGGGVWLALRNPKKGPIGEPEWLKINGSGGNVKASLGGPEFAKAVNKSIAPDYRGKLRRFGEISATYKAGSHNDEQIPSASNVVDFRLMVFAKSSDALFYLAFLDENQKFIQENDFYYTKSFRYGDQRGYSESAGNGGRVHCYGSLIEGKPISVSGRLEKMPDGFTFVSIQFEGLSKVSRSVCFVREEITGFIENKNAAYLRFCNSGKSGEINAIGNITGVVY